MILTTISHKLFVARAEADENGASGAPAIFLNETASNFANKPSSTIDILDPSFLDPTIEVAKNVSVHPISKMNGIAFSFMGGSAADKTFMADFFTWANENGGAKHTANVSCELGTQQVVTYPHNGLAATNKFWADKMTLNWENHVKEVEVTDDVGRNSIGEIWFDLTGLRYVFIQISDADGSTGTEAGDVSCFFRYF
jgi:hypothetical protein